ncbi:hypothetical protein [Paenibacillus sp. sgz302251]|uniref:hypothetical protein n=1 Tax=Paenibacillus sp. sgz302251 TaxID=3414493 RepID=UPI003C7E37D2
MCKHLFAALLDYTNKSQRSIHALLLAKSAPEALPIRKQAAQAPAARQAAADKDAVSFVQLKEQAAHIPALNITEWHMLFGQGAASLDNRTRNVQYVNDALAAIDKLEPKLPLALKPIYQLHALLFVLDKLLNQVQSQALYYGSFIGFHTHSAASEVLNAIERLFDHKLDIAPDAEHWPRVTETIIYLRHKMLAQDKSSQYYTEPYYQLWTHWIQPAQSDTLLYRRELEHLRIAQKKLTTAKSLYTCTVAQSWMHFYLSQDREALALLFTMKHNHELHPRELLAFLRYLSHAEQWSRLVDWLVELSPLLGGRAYSGLDDYSEYWDQAVQQLPEAEKQMWDTLTSKLPNARSVYENKLLTYGKWRQWIDCQLSAGTDPLDYRVSVLAPIEKNAPEVLIPYYHQAIERYVLLKNRDGYKAAVKLLKRLAKLYKKIKKEETWELFFGTFRGRHSRLRALQEELRKGKLIS